MSLREWQGKRVSLNCAPKLVNGLIVSASEQQLLVDIPSSIELSPGQVVESELTRRDQAVKTTLVYQEKVDDYYAFGWVPGDLLQFQEREARYVPTVGETFVRVSDGPQVAVFDVSLGGIAFWSETPLQNAELLNIQVVLRNKTVTMTAVPAYSRPLEGEAGYRIGCQVGEMSMEDAFAWRDYIQSLSR